MNAMHKSGFFKIAQTVFSLLLILLFITTDVWFPDTPADLVRRYTRTYEFDYVGWEIKAIWEKIKGFSLGISNYLTIEQQRTVIRDYFSLIKRSRDLGNEITTLYGDPAFDDTQHILDLEKNLDVINLRLKHQAMLAEPVFQTQLSYAIATLGITKIDTPFPPVLFKTSSLPKQLILSPRDTIRQEKSISLVSDISLQEMIALEEMVENNTDFSALVVPIGGVGTYPSMIIETPSLTNLLDTIAHEWTHNHLTFRPLGLRYGASPPLRTMNETAANISGSEIMQQTLKIFYPGSIKPDPILPNTLYASASPPLDSEIGFSFSKRMYETRVRVDELLELGKVMEAEKFMEEQRLVFWENGYQIRKLNQAYFSFYGAYADAPFSAAGRDPVGEDVRLMRAQQPGLSSFIWKISWMINYRQLRIAARSF